MLCFALLYWLGFDFLLVSLFVWGFSVFVCLFWGFSVFVRLFVYLFVCFGFVWFA